MTAGGATAAAGLWWPLGTTAALVTPLVAGVRGGDTGVRDFFDLQNQNRSVRNIGTYTYHDQKPIFYTNCTIQESTNSSFKKYKYIQ